MPEKRKIQQDGENCIVSGFTMCSLHRTLEGHQPSIQKRPNTQHAKFWSENLLQDSIILKCIRHNKDEKSCSGLIGLRHEIRGAPLNTAVTLTLLWFATISVSRSALLQGVKTISGLRRDVNDIFALL